MNTPDQLLRPEISVLKAYHVPPAQGLIKLDAMENPYTWSPDMQAEWCDIAANLDVNRYPDPNATELKRVLRNAFDIDERHALMLGNGSDEIIQILAMALAKPEAAILAPEPSFAMYKMIATFTAMRYVGVPLQRENFQLDMRAMRAAIEREKPALIFLAYPNNPTGNLFNEADVNEILTTAPGLVVVDEAYHAFARQSYLSKLAQHPNLLVMRTVSKMGLAGLRLGYLVGAPSWLEQLEKLRLPYNINVLTQAAATFALRRFSDFQQQTDAICKERNRVLEALQTFPNLTAFPSAANFVLLRVEGDVDADALHQQLHDDGILLKNLTPSGGLLRNCLRVTVGTESENSALLQALHKNCDAKVATAG